MSDLKQGLFGVLAALLSTLFILGSFALSMTEGGLRLAMAPSPTQAVQVAATPFPINTPEPGEPTFTPTLPPAQALPAIQAGVPTSTVGPGGSAQQTPPPQPASGCAYPPGWQPITVQMGDILRDLANKYDLGPLDLARGNCMETEMLPAGTVLYVPVPSHKQRLEQPAEKCGPPKGWVHYTVRRGDTLSRLSALLGVSVAQLQQANCMANSVNLRAGSRIFVPFQPPAPAPVKPNPTQAPPPFNPPTLTPPPPTEPPVTEPPTEEPAPTQRPQYPTEPPPPTKPPPTEPPVDPPPTEPPQTEPPPTEPPETEPPPPPTDPPPQPPPTEPPPTEPPPATEPPRPAP